jgi:hypothetical protein
MVCLDQARVCLVFYSRPFFRELARLINLVSCCLLASPRLAPRADFGVEKSVNLSKLSEAEIVQKLEALVKDSANMHKSPESNPVKFVDIL